MQAKTNFMVQLVCMKEEVLHHARQRPRFHRLPQLFL